MVIPNMVTKLQNVDIFWQIWDIFDLSSAHACRMLTATSVKYKVVLSIKTEQVHF